MGKGGKRKQNPVKGKLPENFPGVASGSKPGLVLGAILVRRGGNIKISRGLIRALARNAGLKDSRFLEFYQNNKEFLNYCFGNKIKLKWLFKKDYDEFIKEVLAIQETRKYLSRIHI